MVGMEVEDEQQASALQESNSFAFMDELNQNCTLSTKQVLFLLLPWIPVLILRYLFCLLTEKLLRWVQMWLSLSLCLFLVLLLRIKIGFFGPNHSPLRMFNLPILSFSKLRLFNLIYFLSSKTVDVCIMSVLVSIELEDIYEIPNLAGH